MVSLCCERVNCTLSLTSLSLTLKPNSLSCVKLAEARRLNEEMNQVELCEQLSRQHFENQIAEFQDWEENDDDDEVPCPICNDANLLQLSHNGIACPNNMSGTCPLRIERASSAEYLVLSNLRERLGTAHEVHACTCCSPLEFQLQPRENDKVVLVATCNTCHSNVAIV